MKEAETKAKEIFDTFNRVGLQQRDEAKECALICVDKTLELLESMAGVNEIKDDHKLYSDIKQILTDKY